MISCMRGKVCMLIVCQLSYQAIVHMMQHAINPTEHQYCYNATETVMVDNRNPKLL